MSAIPVSAAYVKHWESTLKKKMESTKFMEDNGNKQHTVLVKQRSFNDATFCKTVNMPSMASIETSKLILFCL